MSSKVKIIAISLLLASAVPTLSGCEAIFPTPTPTPFPTATPTATPTPVPTPTIQPTGNVILGANNTTLYVYPSGSFIHPLRMAVDGDKAYLLDAGSLKVAELQVGDTVEILAKPGDMMGDVPIKELGDLALLGDGSLILLDRSGDVYRFRPEENRGEVVRLAVEDYASENQYLASVAASGEESYLLDIQLSEVWQQSASEPQVILQDLDFFQAQGIAAYGDGLFILSSSGELLKFVLPSMEANNEFSPPEDIVDPSLLYADSQFLYLVDDSQKRLRLLDLETGEEIRTYRFADPNNQIRAVYSVGERIYFAAPDAIYLYPGLTLETPTPVEPTAETPPPASLTILEDFPHFSWPISDTRIDYLFRLPAAPRSYRYGVHQGIDFFWTGDSLVDSQTPVLAIADGVVVRADWDFQEITAEEMNHLLGETLQAHKTPAQILDRLRGRQVWIRFPNRMVAYYCHLSAIAEGIEVGTQVTAGQVIGYAGNSGTPESVQYGPEAGIHLHLEIRIGDGYLGQYLRPSEAPKVLAQVFPGE